MCDASMIPGMSDQFSSLAQSCPGLCNPVDCSTSSFSVHHQLPELAQTHGTQSGSVIKRY